MPDWHTGFFCMKTSSFDCLCSSLSLYLLREYRMRPGKANLKNFVFCFALHSPFTIFADGMGSAARPTDL